MSEPTQVVDAYTVTVTQRDGHEFVIINLLTADQQSHRFEFVPPFAYALSNELVKASAKAALKKLDV